MSFRWYPVAVLVAVALLAGCGNGSDAASADPNPTAVIEPTSVPEPTAVPEPTSVPEPTAVAEPTAVIEPTAAPEPTRPPVILEQPAIWPAADIVFATPEQAAADFVTQVLRVPPVLGEFQAGDARSGEIEVLSPGEGGGTAVSRSLLLLRMLGPDDGWFVIGAMNQNAALTDPVALAEVAAGPLEVFGVGRGFEGTVVVEAFVAGDATGFLDQQITQGGSFADPEPFAVTLDLTGTAPGDVIMLLVRGGVGLETDPGDFGAIPVVITG